MTEDARPDQDPNQDPDQDKVDARVEAAQKAYLEDRTVKDKNGRKHSRPYTEIRELWIAYWEACDFSWAGLADAGWDRAGTEPHNKGAPGRGANFAQTLKQWRAPADFPGGGKVHGAGETAWKEATLQDYWRWTPLPEGGWRKTSDKTLVDLGLLVEKNGVLWHALHCPEMTAIPATGGDQRHPAPLDGASHGADVQSAGEIPPAGTGSGAAVGGPLAEAILVRLAAAKEFRDRHADERALLRGARCAGIDTVFRLFQSDDEPPTIHLAMTLSALEALDVSKRHFGPTTSFLQCLFGDKAQFGSASFGDMTQFRFASFGDEAWFHSASFGDNAWFGSASFSDNAQFGSASFGGKAWFNSAKFGDEARFHSAKFGDEAEFRSASFGDGAQFNAASFGDEAWFHSAKFKGFAGWELSEFRGTISFSGAQWDADTHYGRSFKGARFRDVVDFETTNFSAFAAFDEATFEKRLILSEPSDGKRPSHIFASACLSVQHAIDTHCDAATKNDNDTRPVKTVKREVENQRWSELAGGYRVAKKAMQAQGDFEREQRYYRFEVQARLKQIGRAHV